MDRNGYIKHNFCDIGNFTLCLLRTVVCTNFTCTEYSLVLNEGNQKLQYAKAQPGTSRRCRSGVAILGWECIRAVSEPTRRGHFNLKYLCRACVRRQTNSYHCIRDFEMCKEIYNPAEGKDFYYIFECRKSLTHCHLAYRCKTDVNSGGIINQESV